MTEAAEAGLRWGIERRMAFLDACLFWSGQVNRSDLMERFGISVPQASFDLARYQELAPGNLIYDRSRKTYVRGERFRPVVGCPSAEDVLEDLAVSSHHERQRVSLPWLSGVPAEQVLPALRRKVDAAVLQHLLAAIRGAKAARIKYQSLSRSNPTLRWITPHAVAFDGVRWHARAYCSEHRDFRDFVLSRISLVNEMRTADAPSEADKAWSGMVTLRLAPNPQLPSGARRGLEIDYGMTKGVARIRTRVCFSYYIERQLGLDLDPDQVSPNRQQLVLLNPDEVVLARENARKQTIEALARGIESRVTKAPPCRTRSAAPAM